MKRICVFCGSSTGARAAYGDAARRLGACLAAHGIGLVYGGASVGTMGIIADSVLQAGGDVVGVIPRALETRELAHRGLTQLHVVESMHERKALMANLADAFIALPGGLGTMDEFCEILTWAQLGLHAKPCALLNVENYYDRLIAFFDHAVGEGFLPAAHRRMIVVAEDASALLDAMQSWRPVQVQKWLEPDAI